MRISLLLAIILSMGACMSPPKAPPICGPLSGEIQNVTLSGAGTNLAVPLETCGCVAFYSKFFVWTSLAPSSGPNFVDAELKTNSANQFYVDCLLYPGTNACEGDGTSGIFVLIQGTWEPATSITVQPGDSIYINFSTGIDAQGDTYLGAVKWRIE
jgi:hypothetical protein